MVVAVVRADRLIVPRGDTTLQSGDEVLVWSPPTAEDGVHAVLIAEPHALATAGLAHGNPIGNPGADRA